MVKLRNFNLLFLLFFRSIESEIIIRSAMASELRDILDFDRDITNEFFKPLYENFYQHLPIGQNAQHYCDLGIEYDENVFADYINFKNNKYLFLAYDNDKGAIIGFVTASKNQFILQIDLLLVRKDYRGKGIGRKLIIKALKNFDDIKECIVYPLRFGNDRALKFYENLGFQNLGLGPKDKTNSYGIIYEDMHFFYHLI